MATSNRDDLAMRAATEHAINICQGAGKLVFHHYDMVRKLMDLHRIMEEILPSKSPLFTWAPRDQGGHRVNPWDDGITRCSDIGRKLVVALPFNIDSYRLEFPGHKYHPLLELLGRYADDIHFLAQEHTKAGTTQLNRLIDGMRADARMPSFRRRRDAHLRSSRDATSELQQHIDTLFQRCSRVLAIRLDISYRIDQTVFTQSPRDRPSDRVSEEEARNHRAALIHHLKRRYRHRLLTYAWKEELGRYTSYHYHLLLFFDGNQSKSGFTVGNEIGNYWKEFVTAGRGRFHNCAFDRHVDNGLGLISHADIEKIRILKEVVVPYLTKSDYYIRMLSHGRIFGKGGLPAPPRPGRGRPRKASFLRAS